MGLDIGVGWLANWSTEVDGEEFEALRRPYAFLNEVLEEAGRPPHDEPLDLANAPLFEAQMWGYGGLHAVRRMAAYRALRGTLPPPADYDEASKDHLLDELGRLHESYLLRPYAGWLFRKRKERPPFQHLVTHSDCEGFYVPQDFQDVILDSADPEREGLGLMVGSTVRLLEECRELASFIELPDDLDPEDDRLWDAADSPVEGGQLWQLYGVESFCLRRLIRGGELSLQNGAVLAFA